LCADRLRQNSVQFVRCGHLPAYVRGIISETPPLLGIEEERFLFARCVKCRNVKRASQSESKIVLVEGRTRQTVIVIEKTIRRQCITAEEFEDAAVQLAAPGTGDVSAGSGSRGCGCGATGPGAVARNSIGIVLVGGMTIGTLFTLFVVPSVYVLIAKDHRRDAGRVPDGTSERATPALGQPAVTSASANPS